MVRACWLLGKRDSCNICELVAEIRAEKRNKVVSVAIDCLRAGGGCNKSSSKLRDDVARRNLSFASRSISRTSPRSTGGDSKKAPGRSGSSGFCCARLRRKPAIKKVNHKRNGLVSLFFSLIFAFHLENFRFRAAFELR